MIEREVSFKSGEVKLAGTLCLPSAEGSFPCVLMIHGSGPLDRNENARGFPLNAFNTIARHLGDKGIASLRYDKRGIGRSGGSYWDAGFYDFVQDAKSAYDYLASHESISKGLIFLLGHSEGGYIAPKISLTYTSIAGLILIAATVQRLEKVLLAQSATLKKDVAQGRGLKRGMIKFSFRLFGDPQTTQAVALQKIQSTKKASFRYKGQRLNAKWLREILEYDPVYTMRNVNCPVLAISGGKDLQVDPQDVVKIAELAQTKVEHHIIPNMTHLLRLDYGTPSLLEYKRLLKKDIDRSMLDIIVTWLQRNIVSG
jgi:pimeloyl-ACP methyl ester carboxylesterase